MRGREPVGGAVGLRCLHCGSGDLEVTRPGLVEGLRDWLRFGGRWRPSTRVCRRCGHVAVAGSWMYQARRRGGRWWVPVHLIRALRRRRSRIPAPATYLLAVAVGVVLGACAEVALGWPWWLVAAGVLAAVWLFFASSAFWGGRSSLPLATEIQLASDPARAMQRERRALVERFRAAPFPLYGLPVSWPGPRHLGGSAGRQATGQPPVVTALSLAHGDPLAAQGPQLRVEVRIEPWDPEEPALGPGEHWGGVDGLAGREADSDWSEVAILVEGRPVGFELLGRGRHWVARAELGAWTLVLHARDLPIGEVELIRVTDVEPYVEGTRRLEEAARARHLDHDP
jgi:hypothetical protein